MSFVRSLVLVGVLLVSATASQAATVVPVATDGTWYAFSAVADQTANGNTLWNDADYRTSVARDAETLSFSFTVTQPAILRVVDYFTAGDTFTVTATPLSGLTQVFSTSAVPVVDVTLSSTVPFIDSSYDDAFADIVNFSRLETVLNPGTYTVTGALAQSVLDSGNPLNATSGAFSVTAVPEPATYALLLGGLAMTAMVRRRRTNHA